MYVDTMITVICLFAFSIILILNIFKGFSIKKVLLTLNDIDNLKLSKSIEIAEDTKTITDSIDRSIIYFIISYFVNMMFISSLVCDIISNSTLLILASISFSLFQALIPILIFEVVTIVLLPHRYLLYNGYGEFKTTNYINRYDKVYVVESNKEIKYNLTFLISTIIISSFIWIESILYLIISLTTN